jgi:chromosomal replication initiator protein
MKVVEQINNIHAMLAKSSMSELEYNEISKKLVNLKKTIESENTQLTPQEICDVIYLYYGLPKDFYLKKTRKREYVLARQIAITILMDETSLSLTKIAEYFKKNHATCIHSRKTIYNLKDTNRVILRDYDQIFEIINRKKVN